jgi:hypothetical protein
VISPAAKALVATASANEARFNRREVTAARKARRLQEILGFPSTADMIAAVRYGTIGDMGVSTQDIARNEIIYGQNVHAIAGRTTSSPKPPLQFVNGSQEVRPQELF